MNISYAINLIFSILKINKPGNPQNQHGLFFFSLFLSHNKQFREFSSSFRIKLWDLIQNTLMHPIKAQVTDFHVIGVLEMVSTSHFLFSGRRRVGRRERGAWPRSPRIQDFRYVTTHVTPSLRQGTKVCNFIFLLNVYLHATVEYSFIGKQT